MTGAEFASLGVEVAKPVYGTLQKIYKTGRDRAQFRAVVREAIRRGGVSDQVAEDVSNVIRAKIDAAARKASSRIKKIAWPVRINRGPSIDRLPPRQFLDWLDGLYREAITEKAVAGAPESVSGRFWQVLGDAFEAQRLPEETAQYARKVYGTLARNDREHKSYVATTAVVLGGTASAGLAAGLANGATGAVAVDLKTALAGLAVITVTALLGTVARTLDSRLSPRGAAGVAPVKESVAVAGAATTPAQQREGTVMAAPAAPPAGQQPSWRQVWIVASWAIAAGFGVWMAVALVKSQWAQAFGAGTVFAGLALLSLLGGGSYGAFSALIGDDGRTSTSKTQAGLWTIVLAWGIAFLLGRHIFEHQPLSDVLPQDTWDQYLLVLGGPFAAAVLAKGIVTYKFSNGTLTKTTVGPDAATISQVLQNDARQTDLVDSQYFLFNLVAIVYFLVQIGRDPVLPTMPAVLLAATSGAAALYVGYKAASSNKPVISSATPRTARPGELLTIAGSNILGGGDPSQVQVQTDKSGTLNVQGAATDSQVKASLPPGASTGQQDLVIVSGAGNSSDPYNIWVMADAPVIAGLDQPMVIAGQAITIYGQWFTSMSLPNVNRVTVLFDAGNPTEGDITAGSDPTKPDSVTVPAPGSLKGSTKITVVNASGTASSPFSAVVRP